MFTGCITVSAAKEGTRFQCGCDFACTRFESQYLRVCYLQIWFPNSSVDDLKVKRASIHV